MFDPEPRITNQVQSLPLVFILLRSPGASERKSVRGLTEWCTERAGWTGGIGPLTPLAELVHGEGNEPTVAVRCGALDESVAFDDLGALLGSAAKFLGGHGAGLANTLWLPAGAELIELDAEAHVAFARQNYQRMARAVGLIPTKVWLAGDEHAYNAVIDLNESSIREVSESMDNTANGPPPLVSCNWLRLIGYCQNLVYRILSKPNLPNN